MVVLASFVLRQSWATADTWAFEPKPDDFRPDSLLDLRYLNEKTAGLNGFVHVGANGQFLLGDGSAARFWAINSGVGSEANFQPRPLGRKTAPDLSRHARFIAKRGVNLVRLHAQISPSPSQPMESINSEVRDWIWRSVAATKKEGIYTCLSPYWSVPMKFGADWNIDGGSSQSALGLLYFDPKLQHAYKAWLRALLSEKNPYTGISLAQEKAIAVLQIQNEDSLLFWTVNAIQGPQRKNLGRLYGKFLGKKYGSSQNAVSAWSGTKLPGDETTSGVFDFYNIWEMTQARSGPMAVRLADQTEFYTKTMVDFNTSIVRFLRDELGCKQLINAGNWRTADAVKLNDAERLSYLPTDVDAVNRYFTGVHRGPNEGWAISNGDKFTNASILQDPGAFPLNIKQTAGRPMMVTESSWVMPNGFSSEGPFLVSAYQSLTGLGAYFWFATGDDEWTEPTSANGYMPSQAKWVMGGPDTLGTFPAAALTYRKGYIKQARPVVTEQRSEADIWSRRAPIIAETDGFDPNRDARDISPKSSVTAIVDQKAFLVGPVLVNLTGDPSHSSVSDVSDFVTEGGRKIISATREIVLDTSNKSCTVDTPFSQGVTAFFGQKATHKLADCTLSSTNSYGAAMVVSLDNNPIKTSSRILVQYVTQARPTDWQDKAAKIDVGGGKVIDGLEVVNFGRAPWRLSNPELRVVISNPKLKSAVALDSNGNATQTVPIVRSAKGVTFQFPAGTLYVVLR